MRATRSVGSPAARAQLSERAHAVRMSSVDARGCRGAYRDSSRDGLATDRVIVIGLRREPLRRGPADRRSWVLSRATEFADARSALHDGAHRRQENDIRVIRDPRGYTRLVAVV